MMVRLWRFTLVLFSIASTSGFEVQNVDAHQSKTICCEVGRQLAVNSNNCNSAAFKQPKFSGISAEVCGGYMRRCCRNKLKETDCEAGRLAALMKKNCQDLPLAVSEDCCVTCKAGFSSKTCSASWLDDDLMLSRVFQNCCHIIPLHVKRRNESEADVTQIEQENSSSSTCPIGFYYDQVSSACKDIDECLVKKNVCPSESRCINKEGGYECTKTRLQRAETTINCGPGFAYNQHLQECLDVDECAANLHNCKSNEVCLNRKGIFVCKRSNRRNCGIGYTFEHGIGCVDRNECTSGNACSAKEICVNRGGDYICIPPCEAGFEIHPVTVECIDIDECATGTHNCTKTQECSNSAGSFSCEESNFVETCKTGFQRSTRGGCKDIDECATQTHNCSAAQKCFNFEGSFVCIEQCKKGFALNHAGHCEDIDECATGSPCIEASEVCQNTEGGFECKCRRGFEKMGAFCTDVDECKRLWQPCGKDAICGNTIGSFSCYANCGEGYHHLNGSCIDKNECEELDSPCLGGQQCENLPGTYRCVDKDCETLGKVRGPDGTCLIRRSCPLGYRHDLGMDICVDRNECAERFPSACPENSYCTNTVGSFECIPKIVYCKDGMKRSPDGTRCENIDECFEGLHNCDLDTEVCLDRTGSFDCVCREGFSRDDSGKCVSPEAFLCGKGFRRSAYGGECQDINECNDPGVCEHECRNTIGSYECKCKAGFKPAKLDKSKCVDIDECKSRARCVGLCVNTYGSFNCSCPKGYQKKRVACVDINECASTATNDCQSTETCLNLSGDYRCLSYACPTNYTKDGLNAMRCIRNQPCLDLPHCSLDPDLIVFNHLPWAPGSSHRPVYVRISGQRDVRAEFSLHVSKAIAHKIGLAEATDDNFVLNTNRVVAKVYVRKPVSGPQDIHMTLKAKLYSHRKGSPEGRDLIKIVEWRIVLYVPEYEF